MGILSATGVLHTCIKDVVSGLSLFPKSPVAFSKHTLFKEKLFINDIFSVLPAQYAPRRNF